MVIGTVVVIIVVVAAFAAIARNSSSSDIQTSGSADESVVRAVAQPPQSVFAAAGTVGLRNPLQSISSSEPLKGPDGKPQVLYVGADYCPYCAAERWSLIMALGRFGTFKNLHYMASSGSIELPNTPSFTFTGSDYMSKYISFVPVETENRDRTQAVQTPTAQQQQLLQKYDTDGSIPFIDIANKYVAIGSGFNPQDLSQMTQKEVAARLSNPNDPLTKQIAGNANYLTAGICKATGNQPSNVCNSQTIKRIQSQLENS